MSIISVLIISINNACSFDFCGRSVYIYLDFNTLSGL
jgi:hypothetical protein